MQIIAVLDIKTTEHVVNISLKNLEVITEFPVYIREAEKQVIKELEFFL